MKIKERYRLGCAILALTTLSASASVVVDFNPTGEYADQFSGNLSLSESATGGLNGSIGMSLATGLDTFDGSQSESIGAGAFTTGKSFTVGAYLNYSALGTAAELQRLGLTNGGTDNFSDLPFGSLFYNGAGTAKLRVRTTTTESTDFAFSANQWYYLEATFTRVDAANTVGYDLIIATADSDGSIASTLGTLSSTSGNGIFNNAQLNEVIYGAQKVEAGGTDGVMDNFYVSNTGVSMVPEPATMSLIAISGLLALLLRRLRS